MKHVRVQIFSTWTEKHFYKSFLRQSPDNALYGNMNDSHFIICNSDDESDKEMTNMCNIKCKEAIYNTSQNN